jgi:acetylornithine/N-succinyldiaminopimelate aminotransferase
MRYRSAWAAAASSGATRQLGSRARCLHPGQGPGRRHPDRRPGREAAAADHFRPGDHASTFGGNPFACRAGLTVLAEMERRQLLAHVSAMVPCCRTSSKLVARHPNCWRAAAAGACCRAWCSAQRPHRPGVVKAALEQGLLLVPAGTNVVRLVPPLTIKPRQIRLAVKRLEQALSLA